MNHVGIVGHFAFGAEEQHIGGQTIKTTTIAKCIEDIFGKDNIIRLDTYRIKKKIFFFPYKLYKMMKKCMDMVILPARNGLLVLVPVLTFQNLFFHRKLHYVVIGGWLPDFLKHRKILRKQLKKFDAIYVETNTMKEALVEQGFENIVLMPNFKKLDILLLDELVYPHCNPYTLCTFSRVIKEKGIEDAIEAVKRINQNLGRIIYKLDIYGQIDENQIEWFDELKKGFPEYVRYCGVVEFDRSVDVIKEYFALLFPTYYDGEGFAGTIIDSYAAGVPLIASDWRYNSEIVIEGKTGYLFPTKDVDALMNCLDRIYRNPEQWNAMKQNCIEEAKKYTPEAAIKILKERII